MVAGFTARQTREFVFSSLFLFSDDVEDEHGSSGLLHVVRFRLSLLRASCGWMNSCRGLDKLTRKNLAPGQRKVGTTCRPGGALFMP